MKKIIVIVAVLLLVQLAFVSVAWASGPYEGGRGSYNSGYGYQGYGHGHQSHYGYNYNYHPQSRYYYSCSSCYPRHYYPRQHHNCCCPYYNQYQSYSHYSQPRYGYQY